MRFFSFSLAAMAMLMGACTDAASSTAAPVVPAPSADVVKPAVDAAPASQPATAAKAAPGSTPQTRDDVDDDGIVRRGDTVTDVAALSVTDCASKSAALNGQVVKVEGVVDQVCAKKGCWWVLKANDGAQTIRITAKDYGFFVPKDAKGKKAVAEGMLEVKELTQEEADHLAEDGQDPSLKNVRKELRLEARAIEMRS